MNWFSKQRQVSTQASVQANLASLNTSGISLSLEELLQYQRKAHLINLAGSNKAKSKMAGNYLARSKGRGMEFDEVRHYQTGDDIRTIDWRVTARTGKTHTKLFREEVERPVLIATDLSSNMFFGSQLLFKSVQAAHLAALVAWHAKERGDRLGGIVFNEYSHVECKPRSRKQGVLHYLHQLMTMHQTFEAQAANNGLAGTEQLAHQSFEQNCMRIRQIARPGSLVYLITDGYGLDEASVRHLAHISKHCELIVCQIYDSLERQLPQVTTKTQVALTDGQQRQSIVLGDSQTAAQYMQLAQHSQRQQAQLFAKANARLFSLSAGTSLESQLLNGEQSWIR